MTNKRKRFSAEKKVRLLRLHLIEKQPLSQVCDENGLNPNVFYRGQKQFFENSAAAFDLANMEVCFTQLMVLAGMIFGPPLYQLSYLPGTRAMPASAVA